MHRLALVPFVSATIYLFTYCLQCYVRHAGLWYSDVRFDWLVDLITMGCSTDGKETASQTEAAKVLRHGRIFHLRLRRWREASHGHVAFSSVLAKLKRQDAKRKRAPHSREIKLSSWAHLEHERQLQENYHAANCSSLTREGSNCSTKTDTTAFVCPLSDLRFNGSHRRREHSAQSTLFA